MTLVVHEESMFTSYASFLDQSRVLMGKLATGAAVFFAFWVVSRIVGAVVCRVTHHDRASSDLILLLGRTARVAIQVFGAITALGTVGIDVSALVAGLGLTGFALGFAFRDILSNVLAGALILMYRPFVRGDQVSVTGLEGTVTEIDLRYTVLSSEGKKILIPNSNLFTNPIVVTGGSRLRPAPAHSGD